MWRWTTAAAVAVGLTVLIGAAAYAAIPGSSGTIAGCYAKSNGVLRVIDAEAGQTCVANKEAALSWNQQGPPGPAGPEGPAGPAGPGPSLETREVIESTSEVQNTSDGYDMKAAVARCEEGEFVTGGGYLIGASRVVIVQVTVADNTPSYALGLPPLNPPTSWTVIAYAPVGVGAWTLSARAICAKPEANDPPLP
jgi:hypothetical protein